MSIVNKLRKLRKMPPQEIYVRINESWQTRRDRKRDVRWPEAAEAGRHLIRIAQAVVPGATRANLERLSEIAPAEYDAIKERAARESVRVRDGQLELLGAPADLSQSFDWHTDPISGFHWGRGFYADLDCYALPPEVDVKHIWERGRMQYLATLARGWRLLGDEACAALARQLLLGWIQENPPYFGIHWTSSLELAMRAISWVWTLATLDDWDGWKPDDMAAVAQSLAAHGHYLEHHLSHFSSPYNHLMGEATGLLLIAAWIPSHPAAARWKRVATELLRKRSAEQFYKDGYTVEQACGYHFYTTGFLTLSFLLLQLDGAESGWLRELLAKNYQAARVLRQPNGRWPSIGDLDSARTFPVDYDDYWNFDSLCNLGATLLGEGSHDSELAGEETFWLLGADGIEQWRAQAVKDPPIRQAHVLPDAGYVSCCLDQDWVSLEAGPVAAGLHPDSTPSVAHGHDDCLQVLFGVAGKPVLCDPGMPYYGEDPEWVRHFRDAAAHNAPRFDGDPAVKHAGRLAWAYDIAKSGLLAKKVDDVWLALGVMTVNDATIARSMLFQAGRLDVADIYLAPADAAKTCSWHWQIPGPDGELTTVSDGEHEYRADALRVRTWHSVAAEMQLQTAQADSPVGWHSPLYGTRHAASRLSGHATVRGGIAVVLTSLTAGPASPSQAQNSTVQFRYQQTTVGAEADSPWRLDDNTAAWRIVNDDGDRYFSLPLDVQSIVSQPASELAVQFQEF